MNRKHSSRMRYSWSRMVFFRTVKLKPIPDVEENLFLGEGDLHGFGRGDLEALQGVPCGRRLNLKQRSQIKTWPSIVKLKVVKSG